MLRFNERHPGLKNIKNYPHLKIKALKIIDLKNYHPGLKNTLAYLIDQNG